MSVLEIKVKGADVVDKLLSKVTGPRARTQLHRAMITEVRRVTSEHFRVIAVTRHDTAKRLGATPSGFWKDASRQTTQSSAITTSPDNGVFTISHIGLSRALHDVTIVPKQAQSLAIPVNALAYNRSPRQIWNQYKLFIPRRASGKSAGSGVIAMPGPGKTAVAMYALVRSVTQKQDRTLLPSDDELQAAAVLGARRFLFNGLK